MKIQKTNNKKNAMSTQNNMSELGKMPPQAIDFEEVVLGALMLEKSAFISVSEILKPEMFYKENHQTIYYAITLLDYENEPIDILTVTEKLKKIGKLKTVGGAFYITQLTSRIASSANIEYHAW
jgi:replicative DNA helicase